MKSERMPTRRDRQFSQMRHLELLFIIVCIALFLLAARFPTNFGAHWVLMTAALIGGQFIWFRQYRVLDERARLRFLKAWMVTGMFLSNAVALLLLWSFLSMMNTPGIQPNTLPPLPFWPVYLALVGSMLIMWATNRYLRWKDGE